MARMLTRAQKEAAAKAYQKQQSESASKKFIWFGLVAVLLMIISLPSVILIAFGMLPTLVAWLCDRSYGKYATFCIGGLNFSGVFPFVIQLLSENHTVTAAFDIFSDVFSFAIIYGAAGFGWALYVSVPPVISAFITVLVDGRLEALKALQKKTLIEWGTEVLEESKERAVSKKTKH